MTDEAAVGRLEALIQHQAPAVPWTAVTPFDFESRKAIEGKHPQLIRDVFQPTRVLDAGCGPDAILVRLLREQGVSAFGIDPQLRDVLWYSHGWPESLLESIACPADLVICREVLEHLTLRDLVQAVRRLVALSTKYLYLTTRFARRPNHLLDVDTSDDLDPTHITMLTKPFLRTLFVLEGCKSRPDLEAQMDWQQKGRCLVFEVIS